jgi:hypothetical protein
VDGVDVTRKPASHVCMMFLGEPGTYVKLILQRPALSANGRSKTVVVQVERRVQPSVGEAPISHVRDTSALTSTPVSSANTRSQARMPEVIEPSPATASTSMLGAGDESDSTPRPRHSGGLHEGWRRLPWQKRQDDFGAPAGLAVDRALAFNEIDSRHAEDAPGRAELPDDMPRGQADKSMSAGMHLEHVGRYYASRHDAVPSAGGAAGSPGDDKTAAGAGMPARNLPPWPPPARDVGAGAALNSARPLQWHVPDMRYRGYAALLPQGQQPAMHRGLCTDAGRLWQRPAMPCAPCPCAWPWSALLPEVPPSRCHVALTARALAKQGETTSFASFALVSRV